MEQELPLRDIHLPEPVSWWPPAPGWWALAALCALIVAAAVWLWRRLRRRTVGKLALAELAALETSPLAPAEKLRRLSILLRRVGISAASRSEVAGLTGEAWLQWLDQPLGKPDFSRGAGRLLLDGPYRPNVEADMAELFTLCREWLRRLPGRDRDARIAPGQDR